MSVEVKPTGKPTILADFPSTAANVHSASVGSALSRAAGPLVSTGSRAALTPNASVCAQRAAAGYLGLGDGLLQLAEPVVGIGAGGGVL